MKKFLALYYSPAQDNADMMNITEEQRDAIMAAWMAWKNKVGNTVVDFGAPTMPASKSADGNSWSAGSNEMGGYSILQAESQEALQALCVDHPHLQTPGATIELHECMEM